MDEMTKNLEKTQHLIEQLQELLRQRPQSEGIQKAIAALEQTLETEQRIENKQLKLTTPVDWASLRSLDGDDRKNLERTLERARKEAMERVHQLEDEAMARVTEQTKPGPRRPVPDLLTDEDLAMALHKTCKAMPDVPVSEPYMTALEDDNAELLKRVKSLECARAESLEHVLQLENAAMVSVDALNDGLKAFVALMPGAPYVAFQSYQKLNETPSLMRKAREALREALAIGRKSGMGPAATHTIQARMADEAFGPPRPTVPEKEKSDEDPLREAGEGVPEEP